MAKETRKLIAKHLAAMPVGRHNDGEGLYFHVRDGGSRAWVFRYRDRITGKLRDKGLGAYPDVGLADAREASKAQRAFLQAGADPIEAKRSALAAAKLEHAKARTFKHCRDAYYEHREAA